MEKVVENEPEREDAWFRLGYFRLLRGDHSASIEPFRNCVSQRSDWLEALLNLGQAQWRSGDLEAAKASFTQAVARHPQSTDAMRALAALSVEMGDYVQALDAESKLQELGEPMPELAFNIGVLLEKSNLYEDAARSYRRAAEEKPGFRRGSAQSGACFESFGSRRRSPKLLAASGGSEAGTGGEILLKTGIQGFKNPGSREEEGGFASNLYKEAAKPPSSSTS